MTSEALLALKNSQYYFWSWCMIKAQWSSMSQSHSDKARGPVFRVRNFSKSMVFLLIPQIYWEIRQELYAISAAHAVVAGKSTLLKPVCAPNSVLHYHFPYVKSCGAACSLPGKWDLLLLGNLYLCVMFELPGEDGKSFIPVLVPFLGKVSIKSGVCFCCSSGTLHRRLRITRFTGCFITADGVFLHYLPYASPVSIKENRSSYLLLLSTWLILSPRSP